MKSKKIRLKDIAQQLGISTATVSRALRNRQEISQELKEKVKNLAKELHYHPNFLAANLRSQRNFTIGVIIPKIAHQYMASILEGIIEETKSNHYQIIISVTDHCFQNELKAVEQFSSGIVDGLLICVSNHTKDFEHIEQLKKDEIPFILFDKDISKLGAAKVIVDDYTGALIAVEHLIAQGYRNIAHIQDNLVNHSSQKRLKGYYSALKKYGIAKNEALVVQLESVSIANSKQVMKQLLDKNEEIDAVFGITDEIAIGAMQAAVEKGKNIGKDFGVIGFSNWQIGEISNPRLSTIAQPGAEMGRTSTRLLIQRIENPEKYQDHFPTKILKTELVVRESSVKG